MGLTMGQRLRFGEIGTGGFSRVAPGPAGGDGEGAGGQGGEEVAVAVPTPAIEMGNGLGVVQFGRQKAGAVGQDQGQSELGEGRHGSRPISAGG